MKNQVPVEELVSVSDITVWVPANVDTWHNSKDY